MRNPIAIGINEIIKNEYSELYDMLSDFGKDIFFPKGILFQSDEAQKLAKKYNATIGIAKENNKAMYLPSLSRFLPEIDANEYLPYAPAGGKLQLREKWKESLFQKNPSLKDKKISLPVVTSGITHGLSIIGDMFIDKNDKIISPDMLWENYELMFETKYRAKIKKFPFYNNDNQFNLKEFDKIIEKYSKKEKKLILLLNFPNNPCGYSLTVEEASAVVEIIKKYSDKCKFVIALDDAYFGLFYEDNISKESLFTKLLDISKNVFPIKLDAPTKEDYVWGLRLGFITFGLNQSVASNTLYEALEKKITGTIRSTISNCSNLSQALLLNAMAMPTYTQEKDMKYHILYNRYKKVKEILSNYKYDEVWKPYNFNSGYFMCLKLKKGIDSEKLRQSLLQDGVGVIAISDTDVRVAFASVEIDCLSDLFETIYNNAMRLKNV